MSAELILAAEGEVPVRICLSGTPLCSGIRPCVECHQAILQRVIPRAMVGGGFNGDRDQAQAFFTAYGQAYEELLAGLVPPSPPEPPPLDEAVLAALAPPKPSLSRKEDSKPLPDDALALLMGQAAVAESTSDSPSGESETAEGETPDAAPKEGDKRADAIARRARALRERMKLGIEKKEK